MKLTYLLNLLEFDYKINDNNTLSLIDLCSANLNHIEQDDFKLDENLALNLVDRLEMYINDYIISDLLERLKNYNINTPKEFNYEDLLLIIKEHPTHFNDDFKLMECLTRPNLFDVSDIKE